MKSETFITNFPVEIFPDSIQQIIFDTNECLGFPIDYIASSILFATSVAIGSKHKAMVKSGFTQSAALYIALVGRPGANKTHPLLFALKPIFKHDNLAFIDYQKELKNYKKLMRERSKHTTDEPTKNEPVEPKLKKMLVSDTTPEALAATLSFNEKGIGVHVDELAGWFKNFNRYNSGSETEFWLSAWVGSPINIDRKTSEPIYIPSPFISVAGTMQNGILSELAKGDRSENGFMDRILFAIPDNVKKECWSEKELAPETKKSWDRILSQLINEATELNQDSGLKPNILKFTNEAKEILFAWQKMNTDECNNEDNSTVAGSFSKMDMYVVRFALIIQLLNHICNSASKSLIEIEAIKGAIKIAEYFKKSAVKVHDILANPLKSLSSKELRVYEALPDNFQTGAGVLIAEANNMPARTFKRFLTKNIYFEKVTTGNYHKRL